MEDEIPTPELVSSSSSASSSPPNEPTTTHPSHTPPPPEPFPAPLTSNILHKILLREYGVQPRTHTHSTTNTSEISTSNFQHNYHHFGKTIYPSITIVKRLGLKKKLKRHSGCVNTVNWSSCGRLLVSGSDDTRICIWDYYKNGCLVDVWNSGHTANIFSTRFMPETNNQKVISCAADCEVRAFNVNYDQAGQTTCTNLYTDHERRVKRLCTFDNPNTFVSASEDGTVRLFDLRERTGHIVVNLDEIEIHSIAIYDNFFCLGANDPIVRVYDIRNYSPSSSESVSVYASFSPQHLYNNREMSFVRGHVTGVSFHRDEILASYSGDDIYLFNLKTTTENGFSSRKRKREADTVNTAAKTFVQSYSGHCNIRTVKGVSFFGTEAEYVASGSDDGRIFIWEKVTSKLVNIMKGDKQTVNVISGHPNNCVMASSGIDNDIKIWEPILDEPMDLSSIEEIIEENRQRSLIASNPLAWIMDRVGIDDEEDADENNFTCAYQ